MFPTPARFLSIRAELGYIRRGSVVWDDALDPDHLTPAHVRSHYLSIPILGKVRFRLGPGSVYLLAGPTLDQLLKTKCTQDLCSVLNDERPAAFGVTVGSGVSIDFWDRFRADLEGKADRGPRRRLCVPFVRHPLPKLRIPAPGMLPVLRSHEPGSLRLPAGQRQKR